MATFTVLFSNDKKSTVVFGAVRQCLQAIYKKKYCIFKSQNTVLFLYSYFCTVFPPNFVQYIMQFLTKVLYSAPFSYSTNSFVSQKYCEDRHSTVPSPSCSYAFLPKRATIVQSNDNTAAGKSHSIPTLPKGRAFNASTRELIPIKKLPMVSSALTAKAPITAPV